jgi:eukaryotic-like serine/threonine-protein kinase
MLQEKWDQAQRLFLAAADLSLSDRALFLDKSCATDPQLRAEVESLIEADRGSAEHIAGAVEGEAWKLLEAPFQDGRVGPYRILRLLGRGGMGEVFLAARDDALYQKQVAIKIVKRGMDTRDVLERFRHERQILAHLDHPFIARLHDGGATLDGRPYFVMELVEGQPVDAFSKGNKLDTEARLRLFLQICEAVAYAHRNLVIHRDLKPSNILVSSNGAPKLLDFGLARLVNSDSSGTVTGCQAFTPDYASPEQVRGEPVTTATDVYSLGAVLFELLTGKRAQEPAAITPLEVDRAVCQTDVRRPSLLARHLDADLDNIVLMAMRKEPERRYQSAGEFAADIERYLRRDPVLARPSSFRYSVSMFVRRNRWQVAAATVVAASLVAATAISSVQYRRAETERVSAVRDRALAEAESRQAREARQAEAGARLLADRQRDEAQVQRAHAEQRLTDLTNLANRTLFDVDTAVQFLPGALAARQLIVKTTLDYLERLEKGASGDERIRLVLSAGYYKIGLIQGSTYAPSLHDFPGARVSLRKAEALLAPLYRAAPNDPDLMLRWIQIEDGLGDILFRLDQNKASAETYRAMFSVAHRLGELRPADVIAAKQEALQHLWLAQTLRRDETALGLEHAKQEIAMMRTLLLRFPQDKVLREQLAVGLAEAASSYIRMNELEQSAELYRQSIEMREELLRVDPHYGGLQRNLIVANGNYAVLLGAPWSTNLGRFAEARAMAARAVTLARAMVAADSQDANARFDLAMSLSRWGSIEPEAGAAAASLAAIQEAIGLIEQTLKSAPKSSVISDQLAVAHEFAGHRLESLGRTDEAAEQYLASLAETAAKVESPAMASRAKLQAMNDQEALALLYASKGDRTEAFEHARRALAGGEQFAAEDRTEHRNAHLARALFVFSAVHSKFDEWTDAHVAAERALELWHPISDRAILRRDQAAIRQAAEILKQSKEHAPEP